MINFLLDAYLWVKAMHVSAVIAWMAGLYYLPRLYVYHVEEIREGSPEDKTFQDMERRLLVAIMHPAMIVSWLCGILLAFTPGAVDWEMLWTWSKLFAIVGMTWFHYWLAKRRVDFVEGCNVLPGRTYRMMNEVPTIFMLIIVFAVIVRF